MRLLINLIYTATIIVSIAGCKPRGSSQLKHDDNKPIRANEPFNWTKIDRDKQISIASSVTHSQKALPDNHPAVTRIRYWLSLIDQQVRKDQGNSMGMIPTPEPIVMQASAPDAYASTAPVCYDIGIVVDPNSRVTPETGSAISVKLDITSNMGSDPRSPIASGYTFVNKKDNESCQPRHLDDNEIPAFIAWYNKLTEQCKISEAGGADKRKFKLTKTCKLSASPGGPARSPGSAASLRVPSTSNWIIITAGMLKAYEDENMFAFVLAHELGHYYKAHMLASPSEYRFPYQMAAAEGNIDKRPTPIADKAQSDKFRNMLSEIQALQIIFGRNHAAKGEPLATETFVEMALWANEGFFDQRCVGSLPCKDPCAKLTALANDPNFIGGTALAPTFFQSKFPLEELSDAGLTQYKEFETQLNACSSKLAMDNSTEKDGSVTINQINFVIGKTKGMGVLRASLPLDGSKTPKTLKEFIDIINKTVQDKDKQLQELYKSAETNRLGFYTEEQEADEMSIEHLVNIGLSPDGGLASLMILAANREKSSGTPRRPEPSAAECNALMHANPPWHDPSGKPIYIQMGEVDDPHHSYCFRALNMHREVIGHGYKPIGTKPAAPGGTWSSITSQL